MNLLVVMLLVVETVALVALVVAAVLDRRARAAAWRRIARARRHQHAETTTLR